jgi:hypothetical protein
MDKFNSRQRVAAWIAIFVGVVMFAFPYGFVYGEGVKHAPIWRCNEIDFGRLLVGYALLAIVTWATITSFKAKA